MPGRVFVSCGQRGKREKGIAGDVKKLLEDTFGLSAYLAFKVQSFDDIMTITKELKTADYYLLIDFLRKPSGSQDLPCSLFTHQEFALAHHLGFGSNMIALQEEGAPLEGFLKYVLSNPEPFKDRDDLLASISRLVEDKGWMPNYSRNLIVSGLRFTDCYYTDHSGRGSAYQRVWQIKVENRRPDAAAVDTICILDSYKDAVGKAIFSKDRAFLKWGGQAGYQRTILPKESGLVDIFAVRGDRKGLFLHSLRDTPREPILSDDGEYELSFKIFARDFPILQADVKLELNWQPFSPDKCVVPSKAELLRVL